MNDFRIVTDDEIPAATRGVWGGPYEAVASGNKIFYPYAENTEPLAFSSAVRSAMYYQLKKHNDNRSLHVVIDRIKCGAYIWLGDKK